MEATVGLLVNAINYLRFRAKHWWTFASNRQQMPCVWEFVKQPWEVNSSKSFWHFRMTKQNSRCFVLFFFFLSKNLFGSHVFIVFYVHVLLLNKTFIHIKQVYVFMCILCPKFTLVGNMAKVFHHNKSLFTITLFFSRNKVKMPKLPKTITMHEYRIELFCISLRLNCLKSLETLNWQKCMNSKRLW